MAAQPYKYPRLYVESQLRQGAAVPLTREQAHYLGTVLRRGAQDEVRLFNGADGEWLAGLRAVSKKELEAVPSAMIRPQPPTGRRLHLLFAPIKKHRMDFMIEKAAELGVTDLHPVVTENTEIRKLNGERIRLQLIEAAEQCERLDIPVLHELKSLPAILSAWPRATPVYACIERADAPLLASGAGDIAFLIGPEGGFTAGERQLMENAPAVRAAGLGGNILRSETAALACLARCL